MRYIIHYAVITGTLLANDPHLIFAEQIQVLEADPQEINALVKQTIADNGWYAGFCWLEVPKQAYAKEENEHS